MGGGHREVKFREFGRWGRRSLSYLSGLLQDAMTSWVCKGQNPLAQEASSSQGSQLEPAIRCTLTCGPILSLSPSRGLLGTHLSPGHCASQWAVPNLSLHISSCHFLLWCLQPHPYPHPSSQGSFFPLSWFSPLPPP